MRTRPFQATVFYIILAFAVLYAIGPLIWAMSTAFKTPVEISSGPPTLIPNKIVFSNFQSKQFTSAVTTYLMNSFIVALGTITLSTVVSFFAAYAASRFEFRGKDLILFLLWATVMIPGISVVIPLYMISTKLKLFDTYIMLILVYSAWVTPTVTWLLRGFFDSIPRSLEESAILDGCSRIKTFYYIIAPLVKPGLASAAVLGFINVWNEFIIAYTLTISETRRTIQTGLYHMITDWGVEWGPMMAATLTAIAPIVIIFLFLQRSFIQGITKGSTKF